LRTGQDPLSASTPLTQNGSKRGGVRYIALLALRKNTCAFSTPHHESAFELASAFVA
jgi:hypothetical protein